MKKNKKIVSIIVIAVLMTIISLKQIPKLVKAEEIGKPKYEIMMVSVDDWGKGVECIVSFGTEILAEIPMEKAVLNGSVHAAKIAGIIRTSFQKVNGMGYKYIDNLGDYHPNNVGGKQAQIYLFELQKM